MKKKTKFYGYRAEKATEDKRISRLKKAYKARNNSHLFDILLSEADEKILNLKATNVVLECGEANGTSLH